MDPDNPVHPPPRIARELIARRHGESALLFWDVINDVGRVIPRPRR